MLLLNLYLLLYLQRSFHHIEARAKCLYKILRINLKKKKTKKKVKTVPGFEPAHKRSPLDLSSTALASVTLMTMQVHVYQGLDF